jgi:hypothetical protein
MSRSERMVARQYSSNRQVQNTLDPLLEVMTRDYVDDTDLTGRLDSLFKVSRQ